MMDAATEGVALGIVAADLMGKQERRIQELEAEVEALRADKERLERRSKPYIGVGDEKRPTIIGIGGLWISIARDDKGAYLSLKQMGKIVLNDAARKGGA